MPWDTGSFGEAPTDRFDRSFLVPGCERAARWDEEAEGGEGCGGNQDEENEESTRERGGKRTRRREEEEDEIETSGGLLAGCNRRVLSRVSRVKRGFFSSQLRIISILVFLRVNKNRGCNARSESAGLFQSMPLFTSVPAMQSRFVYR